MKSLLAMIVLMMTVASAQAAVTVPSCYKEDQKVSTDPKVAGIQDGEYIVTVSTKDISAKDYALLLNKVEFGQDLYSMLKYTFDGSDLSGETIEMQFHAETATEYKQLVGNRPGAVPFSQIKSDTLAFLNKIASQNGVTNIRCLMNVKAIHHGAGSVSN